MAFRTLHKGLAIGAAGVGVLLFGFLWSLAGWSVRVRAFAVASGAMRDALVPGDWVFVQTAPRPTHRGEVVVVSCGGSEHGCIYRVVGLWGDTVSVREHRAVVNGMPLDEPYVTIERVPDDSMATRPAVVVPDGHIWVLGDNRAESYDSRYWGTVPVGGIRGRPVSIYWSWDAEANRVRWSRIGRRIR